MRSSSILQDGLTLAATSRDDTTQRAVVRSAEDADQGHSITACSSHSRHIQSQVSLETIFETNSKTQSDFSRNTESYPRPTRAQAAGTRPTSRQPAVNVPGCRFSGPNSRDRGTKVIGRMEVACWWARHRCTLPPQLINQYEEPLKPLFGGTGYCWPGQYHGASLGISLGDPAGLVLLRDSCRRFARTKTPSWNIMVVGVDGICIINDLSYIGGSWA